MNEEEEINLVTLLHYVLKRWRSILIAMLIFAVMADLYYVKKSQDAVRMESPEPQSIQVQMEDVKNELTNLEIEQVDRVYAMYAYNEAYYQEKEDYLNNSILMQLNPEEIPTGLLSYRVEIITENEEMNNILAMYENALLDEQTCSDIRKVFGNEYKNKDVRELVSITDAYSRNGQIIMQQSVDAGILNVQIYAPDAEQCEEVAEVLKSRIQTYTQELQEVFGDFSVQNISEEYYTSDNSDISAKKMEIVSSMNSAYADMMNATNGLTENQLTYFNLLKEGLDASSEEMSAAEEANSGTEPPRVNFFSLKYILVGILAGLFLMALFYAAVFVISQSIKDIDDVKIITGLPVFGSVLSTKEVEKRNKLDKWIDSLFTKGKKEDNAVLLERICLEIELQAQNKNVNKLLLTGSVNIPEVEKMKDELQQKLTARGLNVARTDSIASDNPETLHQLQNAEGVIFVEQLMKSLRSDIISETELCRRYQIEMLGNVVCS